MQITIKNFHNHPRFWRSLRKLALPTALFLAFLLSSTAGIAQVSWKDDDEDGGLGPLERQEWFYKLRSAPNYPIPANALQNAWEHARLLPTVSPQRTGGIGIASVATWQFWGPDSVDIGWTGRVNTLAIHPTTPSTLYIGAAKGACGKRPTAAQRG